MHCCWGKEVEEETLGLNETAELAEPLGAPLELPNGLVVELPLGLPDGLTLE